MHAPFAGSAAWGSWCYNLTVSEGCFALYNFKLTSGFPQTLKAETSGIY